MKVLTDLRRFVSAWHLRDVRGMLGIVEILEILLILDIPLQTAEGKRAPDDSVSDICRLRSPERKIGQAQASLPYSV